MKFTYDLNETRATDGRPYNVFFIFVGVNFVRPLFVCGYHLLAGRRGRRPLQDTNIGIASALSLNCYSFVRKFLKGVQGGTFLKKFPPAIS